MSALPPRADIRERIEYVCFVPIADVRVAPAPTHTEIASRVSTHREAVTRELTRLSRTGLIERQRNGLLVKDVERLAEMVHAATGE